MLIENLLYLQHISCGTDERVGNEVNVFLYRQQDVAPVLLGQCRQLDMLSRHIHTLVRPQVALILYLRHQHRTGALNDFHVQRAVIEEDVVAHLHVA